MNQPWQDFYVDEIVKKALKRKLEAQPEIFSFTQEPLLASLTTCLGLASEVGHESLDRLSCALNINSNNKLENPWKTQIISYDNKIGVRLWINGVTEFYPDHPDFSKILHPFSINKMGQLDQIIIFPADVALHYKKRQLDLVVVRDWALTSFMSPPKSQINYFRTNEWEIKSNCARLQTLMMPKNQVAFIGTHDLVDHLLGGDGLLLARNQEVFKEAYNIYQNIFTTGRSIMNIELITSYLIGVILDDMAQPRWYNSKSHKYLLLKSLGFLNSLSYYKKDTPNLDLPNSFHELIKQLRKEVPIPRHCLDGCFTLFTSDLLSPTSYEWYLPL